MSEPSARDVHWSFWIISVIALMWNGMGVVNYFMQLDAGIVATMSEFQQQFINTRPAWATGGFAIAVFGGTLGCIGLLLRMKLAIHVLLISMAGIVLQLVHSVGVLSSGNAVIEFSMVFFTIMPVAVGVFLVWYANRVLKKPQLTA
ncbi:MAG: hypothetical protein JKY10_06335 [Cohaesibacteraceae bacterium]|nr:hypothetical protein [Cohaesibacteraceae bacterium]